jgi:hypothetical protein
MIGRTSAIAALAMIGVAVGVTGPDPSRAEPPRGSLVFYLTALHPSEETCATGGCEWRTFDPRTGEDRLFLALPTPPSHVFWNASFGAIHYLRDGTLYRAAWRYGANPQSIVELPVNLDQAHEHAVEIWHDEKRGGWTLTTLSYSSNGVEMAHVWEQFATDKSWRRARSVPSHCEKTGPPCMPEVAEPSESVERVSLEQIQNEMRIYAHLIRTGQRSDEEKLYDLRSRSEPGSTVRVRMGFGDSAHAMQPLSLVLASGEEHTVELGANCSQQLAFDDVDGFLLLGTEYVGSCSKLVNLRTGRVIRSFPERSRGSVWVSPPRPDENHAESR